MKNIFSLVLAMILLFACGTVALADDQAALNPEPVPETEPEKTEVLSLTDVQLAAAAEKFDLFRQDGAWYYAVTDLDHNGRIEILAAPYSGGEAKLWEASEDGAVFSACALNISGESFPDILMENANTYHDPASDVWHYMFSKSFTGNEMFSSTKCSVSLKNGELFSNIYASENAEYVNGYLAITFTDMAGNIITPEEYNSAGENAFAGYEKSSTNFGWFKEEEAGDLVCFVDSYSVFTGEKDPKPVAELFPTVVSAPEEGTFALPEGAEQLEIVMVDTAEYPGAYTPSYNTPNNNSGKTGFLRITKNPTNENRTVGSTARFVAIAENYVNLKWTFVDPYGKEYSVQEFSNLFPNSTVSGSGTLTLDVSNVTEKMAGWGTYCTFNANGQTARTNTAYISIRQQFNPTPSKSAKRATGYVTDYLMSTVTIRLENGNSVQVNRNLCSIVGNLQIGAPCDVYYNGDYATSANITWVSVQGVVYNPTPSPVHPNQQPSGQNGGTVVIGADDPYKK